MKSKNLLFPALLLLMSVLSQAQTIDPGSQWRVDYSMAEPNYSIQSHYVDFIDGDTSIASHEYYKVYFSGYSTFNGGAPNYFHHSLHGLLREENNRWYTFYEDRDTLLYDFTLEVGDTVYSAFTQYNDLPILVDSVDSIMVDGDYKRRMHLSVGEEMCTDFIIEDIGATSGLFENMYFFEWGSDLVCYAKDGVSVWGESTGDCDLAVDIAEVRTDNNLCYVYPNPCEDYFILSIPMVPGQFSFTLTDVLGKIVYQGRFEGQSTKTLDVSDYPPGIYFVIFESKGQRQTEKLVIE
jgi:hypothetical protein